MAAELLVSLFLMHNTCVHSSAHFAGVFRKPYDIPQTKDFNYFQVKNGLNKSWQNKMHLIFHYFK